MSVKSKPELEKESGSHFFGINKTWQRRLHCPFYLSPSLCLYLEFFLLFFFSLYAAATARTRFIAAGGTIYVLQLKAPATVSFCKFMFLRLNKSSIVRLYLKAIMFFFFFPSASCVTFWLQEGQSGHPNYPRLSKVNQASVMADGRLALLHPGLLEADRVTWLNSVVMSVSQRTLTAFIDCTPVTL